MSLRISQVLPTLHRLRPVTFGARLRDRFCINASAPIGAAAQKMAANRLTFVMVCEDEGDSGADRDAPHVLGMVTERDFMRYLTYAADHSFFSGAHPLDKRTDSVMTPLGRMTALSPETTVSQALRSIQHRIWRHLPVVSMDATSGKGVLTSIIGLRDLIQVSSGVGDSQSAPLRQV